MATLRPLNTELQQIVHSELNEDPSRIPENLEALRTWIIEQPYLKTRTDDQFLISFLRFCKHDLDDAKKRIDYYYTYKTSMTSLLKSRRIDEKILEIAKAGIFYTLQKPQGAGGPRIHFNHMGHINPAIHSIHDLFRFHTMRSEIEANMDDNWNISGILEIVDFSKIPFGFLRQFDASLFRQMSNLLEYGIPTNLIGTHVVNASMEVQIILALVRKVMKQKNLLTVHSSIESLQEAIGIDYLPLEYGGTNGSLAEAEEAYEKVLLSYKSYFDEDDQYGVDENLRPNDTTTNSAQKPSGAFWKFNID